MIASLLSACSAIRLAYNQVPDLSYWWLDSYFDFNSQQTPIVRDELAKLHAWHRKNELSKAADLLAQAAQLAPSEITAEQSCRLFDQGRSLLDNLVEQALPALAQLAPTVTAEQIEHLRRKYAKNAEEFKRDFVSGSATEREARRLKRSVDRSEMLYGRLEDAQIAAVKQGLAQSGFDVNASIKERERRQRELIDLLTQLSAAKASASTSQHALRVYFQRVWESPDASYRVYAQRMLAQSCLSFSRVHASTTAQQRANAVKVLRAYEADLRALASSR